MAPKTQNVDPEGRQKAVWIKSHIALAKCSLSQSLKVLLIITESTTVKTNIAIMVKLKGLQNIKI
jgi:hypothetical protein